MNKKFFALLVLFFLTPLCLFAGKRTFITKPSGPNSGRGPNSSQRASSPEVTELKQTIRSLRSRNATLAQILDRSSTNQVFEGHHLSEKLKEVDQSISFLPKSPPTKNISTIRQRLAGLEIRITAFEKLVSQNN